MSGLVGGLAHQRARADGHQAGLVGPARRGTGVPVPLPLAAGTPCPVPTLPDGPPLMDAETRQKQVGGNHYASKPIQPWDVILVYGLDFWEGNALKYLLRDKVNRLEDLRKARHYLDECIRQEEARRLESCPF